MLNGLVIQALTSEAVLEGPRIRDEVIRTLFPAGVDSAVVGAAG